MDAAGVAQMKGFGDLARPDHWTGAIEIADRPSHTAYPMQSSGRQPSHPQPSFQQRLAIFGAALEGKLPPFSK